MTSVFFFNATEKSWQNLNCNLSFIYTDIPIGLCGPTTTCVARREKVCYSVPVSNQPYILTDVPKYAGLK